MPTSISIPAQAASTPFNPTGSIAATSVQNAIAELAAETIDLTSNQTVGGIKSFNAGVLNLTNAVNNLISYANAGLDVPTFTTRSLGTKAVFRSGLSSTATEYALGTSNLTLWQSIPVAGNTYFFKWFAGITEIASLAGDGLLSLQKLTVASVNPWVSPTFQNTWTNFGAGHATAGYRKLPDGTVELKGLIAKSTTPTVGETIFTLATGFRPLEKRVFSTISNGALSRIDVDSLGNLLFMLGSNTGISLDGIRFVAEQ